MKLPITKLAAALVLAVACSDPPSPGDDLDPETEVAQGLEEGMSAAEASSWPGGVAMWIDRGCEAATCSGGSLAVEIVSLRRDDTQVAAWLAGDGLDGRSARIRIDGLESGTFRLGAGERRRFQIAADALPVQSVGTLSSLRAELSVADGQVTFASISDPVTIEHQPGYKIALSYDVGGALERGARLDPAVLVRPVGRFWDGRAMVDVATLPPVGGKGYTLGGGTSAYDFDTTAPAPDVPPPPTGTRVCFDLKVSYVDAGFGEDYVDLPASGGSPAVQSLNGSYMRAWVSIPFQDGKLWDGYLNSIGCTPQLTLADGNYVLTVKSELQKQVGATSANVAHQTIKLKSGVNEATKTWNRFFEVTEPGTVDVTPTTWDRTQNVVGVIARMYLGSDNWLTEGTANTIVDRGCPGNNPSIPATDSCAGYDTVYIGPGDLPEKPPQSLNKFLVAHEHGHQVQARSFPVGGGNYDEVIDTNFLCRCDQVTQSNQLHCMQSLEVYTSAFIEGFAHFYGSKLYNNRAQSDCMFVYYKEIAVAFGVLDPPMGVDCIQDVQWRDNYCSEITNSATEMDFMRFLWDLYATGPDRLSAAEIDAVFTAANVYPGPMTWTHLREGAKTALGNGTPKYLNLVELANDHAVDDDFGL